MPKFRSAKAQAEHAVSQKVALGRGRHDHRDDGCIHSVGTARNYGQALKIFTKYIQDHRMGDLHSITVLEAQQYLADRATKIAQKTLDLDRQAIQMHLGTKLKVIKSERETCLSTRSYSVAQVERIAAAQSEHNSLATRIAYAAGMRAHELLTLWPVGERQASTHREWSAERFNGRTGARYTVEARRLATPRQVTDRGVNYTQRYDINGGRAWSQSFSAASKRTLAFSNGAHGLRHSYAQERMEELQRSGLHYDAAKATVAQELGHFDKETTEAYLR